PGKGESYVLTGNRIIIGRSEKADIRINDAKASREHAEITKAGDTWFATDLGSQNGVVVNEKKITQQSLAEGDKLIVGQTVFKFARVEVAAKAKANKEDAEEEKGTNKSFLPFLILIIIFASLFLFDSGNDEAPPAKQTPTNTYQNVNNEFVSAIQKRQATENKQMKEKLTVIYQRGLRELRERNYFRAIHE